MNVRVTLTVGYIWVLAFASNKPYIEFVNASLLHLDDHDLAVPTNGLDRYDTAIHDAVFSNSQNLNG